MVDFSLLLDLLEPAAEEVWAGKLFSLTRSLGFEQTLYGVVPDKSTPLENAFLRSNYSEDWRLTYDREKFHYIDPTVSHCLRSSLPLSWEPGTFNLPTQKQMYEEASSYGLRSGITYPIHGHNGEFGVISFVSDAFAGRKSRRVLDTQLLASLSMVRDVVFESSLQFIRNPVNASEPPVRLTSREIECLKWLMEGKSSWEISKILGCSEATVIFHVTNIRSKFRVRTRQQVIVKAIKLGILTPH